MSTVQQDWRMCVKCDVMFFDGGADKGACAADGKGHAHADDRFMFVLRHDVPEDAKDQGAWRFCNKCFCMFFTGDAANSHCAGGDVHVAEGFVFALPHLAAGAVRID